MEVQTADHVKNGGWKLARRYSVNESRNRIQLIRSLLPLKRLSDAENIVKECLMVVRRLNHLGEEKFGLENALEKFFALRSKESVEVWLDNLDSKIKSLENGPPQVTVRWCVFCNLSFESQADLMSHCTTQEHETMIMSDEGHDWNWRVPPRGVKSDRYVICESWKEVGTCRFGGQCVDAHGEEELLEWKDRFQYREMKMERAKEKELFGKSYTEDLLEKLIQATDFKSVMSDKIDCIEDTSRLSATSVTVSLKNSNRQWKFSLNTRKPLKAVALLQDTHRNHFHLAEVNECDQKFDLKSDQEFVAASPSADDHETPIEYTVIINFQTTIFGTFRQSVVFDFAGCEPILVKHLCVDVVLDADMDRFKEIRKDVTCSLSERWIGSNSDIVPFRSTLITSSGSNQEWETNLKTTYPVPQDETFVLSNATVSEVKKLTRNNYRERMHELLFVEEIARYNLVAQYNLTAKLQIAHSYFLLPNSKAANAAKYSIEGELFASVRLSKELSEDTVEGRLILMNCHSVYLLPRPAPEKGTIRKVYEALIEDKAKDVIYLRLSAETVQDLNLTTDTHLEVQIQFQLNRIPYCQWHFAIDKIRNYKLIFPDTYVEPIVPWSPSRQWSSSLDSRLNTKQKEAVLAMTTPLDVKLPPILVMGPFGTGKTFTLAQGIKDLIEDASNKILVCTHSNSAADLYIKDYLDPWVEAGNENARPLRICYQKRWVTSVNPVVQKYCLIKTNGVNSCEFQLPTIEDIDRHRIVITTFSTSVCLSAMALPPDTFTHILLDEAAQALECETITPLTLASEKSRIVLAGDHMQLRSGVHSRFAKERNLHISLLERVHDHYPQSFPCKILLVENYRAHESIVQFTSESFYDRKLVSSSKQPRHPRFYPLTFFTARGEDVQDKNSTAFYNNSEVYEVVERVEDLIDNWPREWGQVDEQSIGVFTPYADQVYRIRSELRKRYINVCVERVLNVQGKQFRAIVLSTVRTRRTCTNKKDEKEEEVEYGFLSNAKLLNTAITRAQSLVEVVGDPVALCSLGRCSKVWERFIQICNDNDSLYGMTFNQLHFQLDGIELKKVYTLNPLAPEFIPRKYRERQENLARMAIIRNNIPHENGYRFRDEFPPLPPPPRFLRRRSFRKKKITRNNVRVLPLLFRQKPPMIPMVAAASPVSPIRVLNPDEEIPAMAAAPTPNVSSSPTSLLPEPTPRIKVVASSAQRIQLLDNVHLPKAQTLLSDCVNLLPQQISLTDMLQQPSAIPDRWYNHLKERLGQAAAEKFTYHLHTTRRPLEFNNNSSSGVNEMKQSDAQKYINDLFAKLPINNTSDDDWFEKWKEELSE